MEMELSDLIRASGCLVTALQLSTFFVYASGIIFYVGVKGKRFGGVSCTHVNHYD
jgi:hypothetical protein